MLEDQRVSVCAGGAQARCSVLVWLARRAAAARVEDAGLVEMLSDVILRPPGGHWKGSALRAHGEKPWASWKKICLNRNCLSLKTSNEVL